MTSERVSQAMARLEAALQRIERAGTSPRGGGDAALANDNAKLRATVQQTLDELDALIGELEG